MQAVAISGMGAVSAAGIGTDRLWCAARDGISGIAPIDLPHARGNHIRIAAAARDFDPGSLFDSATLQTCDRYAQFALCAANEAVTMSAIAPGELAGDRTAVIIGTGVGGIGTLDEGCRLYYGGERFSAMAVPLAMPSSAASHVGIAHGVTGPTFAVASACASASQAIGVALTLIRAGLIDRAIAGGAEACITPATMRGWEYLRVLTRDKCRPFSTGRSGMSIGEGAGVFVLESEAALTARSATPLAWLSGYGCSSDARDMIQPDIEGAAKAMKAAIADAGLPPDAIGYVNAHGTGTVLNDINEAQALHQVFGDGLGEIPVSSSKPIIGHALGAAGALELAITVSALREQALPPQINFIGPDPKCALNLPLQSGQAHRFDAAMSNSFAFGGINATLIVERA